MAISDTLFEAVEEIRGYLDDSDLYEGDLRKRIELVVEQMDNLRSDLDAADGNNLEGRMGPWLRSPEEIKAEEEKLFDIRWYNVHKRLEAEGVDVTVGKAPAKEIEAKYSKEELGPHNLYARGYLDGTHQAIRWVMGSEPNNLDT